MKHKHYFKFKLGERVSTPNGIGTIISCQLWIDRLETDEYDKHIYVVSCGIYNWKFTEDKISKWRKK